MVDLGKPGRTFLGDESLQDLITGLCKLYLQYGNANRLRSQLDACLDDGETLHVNRLHTLLSNEASRSINSNTRGLVEKAVAAQGVSSGDEVAGNALGDRIIKMYRLRQGEYPGGGAARYLANLMTIPAAVIHYVLVTRGVITAGSTTEDRVGSRRSVRQNQPDWSFQDDAVRQCLRALNKDPNRKVGLVIPTGGGKTRVALRIAAEWLKRHDGRVVWVVHRLILKAGAYRELQELQEEGVVDAASVKGRIDFSMVSDLPKQLKSSRPCLVIVDEAHHVAAPSYQHLFNTPYALPALLMTATPNRTDALPIGTDEIAYTTTYRELADRKVILIPEFENHIVSDFEWNEPDDIADLVEHLLDRCTTDFTKVLVIAPRIVKVREFYDALLTGLEDRGPGYPLDQDDIGYVTGDENSTAYTNEEFLELFKAKPRAIYVSAGVLLEGYNDKLIDAVVLTNSTRSLVTIMQAAGRCVRIAEGKEKAFVLRSETEDLGYRFDNRWLYQEIRDYLRPRLDTFPYGDHEELVQKVQQQLVEHRVDEADREEILTQVSAMQAGDRCRLMFHGLPYFDDKSDFEAKAKWACILETDDNATMVREMYNAYSDHAEKHNAALEDSTGLLAEQAKRYPSLTDDGTLHSEYGHLYVAMYRASEELQSPEKLSGHALQRSDRANPGATTWLRYVTFEHHPMVNAAVADFLLDCYNAEDVKAELSNDVFALLKVPVPYGSHEAYAVTAAQYHGFMQAVSDVRRGIEDVGQAQRYEAYLAALTRLSGAVELPYAVIQRLQYFLHEDDAARLSLVVEE